MRPIRTVRAAVVAPFESLGTLLSSHRAITRVSLAALSFTLIIALSQQTPATQAGPELAPVIPKSLLPENVGIGVSTDDPVTIAFDGAMNPGSVAEALQVLPAQPVELTWNQSLDQLTVAPEELWRTEESYLVIIGASSLRTDGQALDAPSRHSFTTQTAPIVSDFQVHLAEDLLSEPKVDEETEAKAAATLDADAIESEFDPGSHPPTMTATDVSASTAITVSFSQPMNAADVEDQFAISPEVDGDLSWDEGNLIFSPSERLEPGSRYTISVIGSHDRTGNLIGGKGNFSFIVQQGAQVTKSEPLENETDVQPKTVELWFSQPMDVKATNEAFRLTDTSNGAPVAGKITWNEAGTQLVYAPSKALVGGRKFAAAFEGGARDADGNRVDVSLSFTTKAPPVVAAPPRASTSVRTATPPPAPPAPPTATAPPPTPKPAPAVPRAAPATSLAGYALNQVNAARAAYGFAPVVLDAAVSAVASSHAMDQAQNGYFSHTGANGSTRDSRLRAGGVSFGWSGENQCYHIGMSQQATLDWCHAQFMAEPYPGHWNHIANILNANARRMGVGIATVGSRTVITWNFVD
ncbi:MAG: Ig-like domain-containing protein [Candidatus Limnocylindria bacterium]